MKGKLNIYRDNFLEKEELNRLMSFINDNPAMFLFVSNTQNFGILQQLSPLSIDPAFKVEVGTNANTIKIAVDSYAFDKYGQLIQQRAFDNLPIPIDDQWYWVKISHRYDNYEQGFVNIADDGTLSGAGTHFTEVFRGISSGFPTKVKFYKQASDGTLSPADNSDIYEVVSVGNDTTATISGNLVAEDNLRYVVLGTFSIKTSIGEITSTGIFSYDSCQIDFIAEEVEDTPPTTGFLPNEHFYTARIKSDGTTVTVQDKRVNYYFRMNFGDIIVSNKANVDASNLAPSDVTAWLAKLSVYTQAYIDTALTAFLQKSQNLNDLANKTTARDNLSVYDKGYIDATFVPLSSLTFTCSTDHLTMQTGVGPSHPVVTPSITYLNYAKISSKVYLINFTCVFQMPPSGSNNHLYIVFGSDQGSPHFSANLTGSVVLYNNSDNGFVSAALCVGYNNTVLDYKLTSGNYINSKEYILTFSCALPIS